MDDYYAGKLSARRLKKVYEIATPRVKRYLEAEIEYLLERISPDDRVLELGCGYGRILERLLLKSANLCGIDTGEESLHLALDLLGSNMKGRLFAMDAVQLGFKAGAYDLTICMQNGISAFRVDPIDLFREAVRVTRPGGSVVFSSYAAAFWPHRLEWFRLQSAHGLIGEIDEQATGCGVIACKDGFRATTVGPEDFRRLADRAGVSAEVAVLNEGSVICKIAVH